MLTPSGEWSAKPCASARTTTVRPPSDGRDSSQKSAVPSEQSSERDTLARATSAAASGEAQSPYLAVVITFRTYPVRADAPEDRGPALYSEPVRFAAYLLSKAGAVIRPAVVELSDTDLPEGAVLVRVEWSEI